LIKSPEDCFPAGVLRRRQALVRARRQALVLAHRQALVLAHRQGAEEAAMHLLRQVPAEERPADRAVVPSAGC